MTFQSRLKSIFSNRAGNMGVTFIMLSAVITASVSVGIETARLASNKSFVQDLGDSAALYGATLVKEGALGDEAIASKVREWMIAQLTGGDVKLDAAGIVVSIDRTRGAVRIEANAEQEMLLPFLQSSGAITLTAITEAGAADPVAGGGLCGLALDQAAQKAMHFKGDGAIDADDCVFWSNSRDKDSTHGFGDGGAATQQVCSVGKYSKAGSYAIAPPPEDNCAPQVDPYAGWTPPKVDWTRCDFNSVKLSGGGGDITLLPGIYCGGLDVANARDVTFKPGRYSFNGKTIIDASRRIAGADIYLHFEGADTTIDFKADAIDLRHAGDKDLSKVLVYKKADATKPSKVLFEAKSDFRGEGVFYLPGDEIEFKIARVAGAPGFGFGAIARLVLLDIAKGDTFAFKPLIRIEDGEATLNEGAAIRLLR